jgi:hypothetical protein
VIGKWLHQDPAIRSLASWIFIGPLSMSAVLGLVAWRAAYAARQAQLEPGSWSISSLPTWLGLFWLAVVPYLITPGCRERCSRLCLALPLSPRKLWLGHLFAVFAAEAAIVFVAGGMVLLNAGILIYVLDGRNIFQLDILRLAAFLVSSLALVTVIVQSLDLEQCRIRMSGRNVFYMAIVLVGICGFIGLGSQSSWFALVLLVAAIFAGWRTYCRLPASFLLVTREADTPSDKKVDSDRIRPVEGVSYFWFELWTVWRCLGGGRLQWLWFAVPCLLPFGILLAGVSWIDSGLYYARFVVVPITVYMLLAAVGLPMRNLYRLDNLPLSRRRLLAYIFVPGLALIAMGYGAGKLWEHTREPTERIAYLKARDSHFYLYVPAWALEVTWNGHVPDTTSPWGETHEVWSAPLWKGARTLLYSPCHTPPGSSLDFVALQISRAVEQIYGEAIPIEEIKYRYLKLDSDGKVVLRGDGLSLREDYPHLVELGRGPQFPVILLLVGLPWMLLVSVYMRSFRATISDGKRKAFLIGLMMLVLVVHLGQYGLFVSGLTGDRLFTGFIEILIREAIESFPGAGVAIWIACVVLLYFGFKIAEHQFRRIEIPTKPAYMNRFEVWASN